MINESAPEFCLPDRYEKEHSLLDFYGKWLLLACYFADEAFAWKTQIKTLLQSLKQFEKLTAVLFGISSYIVEQHAQFAKNDDLTIPLLADPDLEMISQYTGSKRFGSFSMASKPTILFVRSTGYFSQSLQSCKHLYPCLGGSFGFADTDRGH